MSPALLGETAFIGCWGTLFVLVTYWPAIKQARANRSARNAATPPEVHQEVK